MKTDLLYQIALTFVPRIGDKLAKTLIAHCGSAEAVFRESEKNLLKIPGVGKVAAQKVAGQSVLSRAEEELQFIEKEKVTPLWYLDEAYPRRLKMCEDGPVILYKKGNADLNKRQVIAIVGSRKATDYGKSFCENFIQDLKPFNPLIISGLAYGIDIAAHRAAVKNGIPTAAVLAHGLDLLYPSLHQKTAQQMIENGGLLSDYPSGTKMNPDYFPARNRIVAGISDAIIVVEAAKKGGALITANISNTYNRDVFAVPGRLGDSYSEGTNWLIKTNKAALLQSAEDLKYILGWEEQGSADAQQQTQLFVELEGVEKQVYEMLRDHPSGMEIDLLCQRASKPMGKILPHLMKLEIKGLVKNLPGKVYKLA